MSANGDVIVFVEIPAGSRNKYEVDKATGAIFLDRRLFTSTSYPADYGFIEGTLGGDSDPLDALVLAGDPTFPGCRIRARAIGLFRMTDEKGPDEKIICVSSRDPFWSKYRELAELDQNLLDEIDHFFRVYKELETNKVDTRGFADRAEAERVIDEARARLAGAARTSA
jgi:inorganic pyrophosphatase